MKPNRFTLSIALLSLAAAAVEARAGELAEPFSAEANGQPIDMTLGSAAPYLTDFDGDGVFDLLVGQRGECKLRIYRNQGSNTDPKFEVSAWFKADGVDASLSGG